MNHEINTLNQGLGSISRQSIARAVGLIAAGWFSVVSATGGVAQGKDVPIECPKPMPPAPDWARAQTYEGVPFKPGEESTFEVSWAGMNAGFATMEVRPPIKHGGKWHRVFHAEAKTGDWFKTIFTGHDIIEAYSRPWDFGVSKFYLEQYEQGAFKSAFISKKWLDFLQEECQVKEKTWRPEKSDKLETFPLSFGAIDALSVVYFMRTKEYKIGQTERAPVYTSEKNWFLEAKPLAFEKVTVPAGTFDAVKIQLHTYLGKALQQKGDVFVWVSTGTPQKQILQIQGEIKIGSVWMKLKTFQPGN